MMRRSLLSALVLLAATATNVRAATTWLVPGDGSNVCTTGSPNCDTIALANAAASSGDTISITAASTPVTAAITFTKQLTISGAGIGSTTVSVTGGVIAFQVSTSGLVFQDFTLSGGATGIRFNAASTGTAVTRVAFSGQTSRGIEFTGPGFTVSNVSITDSSFTSTNIGIRMSSTSTVNGLAIAGTTFSGNNYGIYQANDGSTSTLTGLAIAGSTFTSNVNYAIYAEEMTQSTIEDSTFTGGGNGILIIKFYSSNATPVSDIGIRRNAISGMVGTSIELQMRGMALGTPGITVEDNVIAKDVGSQTAASSTAVYVRLHPTLANGQVDILNNTITLSGTYGVGTATHGVQLIGNGPIVLTGNVIDGGGVGGAGTTPPSSGVFVQSKSASVTTAATFALTATCNRIQNFHDGVTVFDTAASAYGGLDPAATVSFQSNAIVGNDLAGAANGATPTLDFENDWWGCVAGPGNPGCDAIAGAIDASPNATAVPACVSCGSNAECDDGLFCTGVETCNVGTNQCDASPGDPCAGGDVCGNACNEASDTCVVPNGTPCRPSAGQCDVAETCDGVGTSCPADGAAPDLTPCDDGEVCTIDDVCTTGVCGGNPDTCGDGTTQGACGELCDDGNGTSGDGCSATCQPEFVCTPTPLVGCRTSESGKSQLQLKDKSPDTKDQAQWKYGRGAVTPKADFGSPLTTTNYQLCLYANGALVSRAFVPAGGSCAGKPCWKENAKGFQYKDKDATPDGVTQLKLKEGTVAGKSQIQVKLKGAYIDMPTLPLALPVRVQLKNANGVCWETTHSAPAAKNDAVQFKDKND